MFHVVDDLFDRPTLAAVAEAAAGLSFEDGRKTAGGLARRVKDNAQAADTPDRAALLAKIEEALFQNPTVASAARPKRVVRLLVSSYAGGQTYGSHVDNALMDGARTDLSFTLFLSEPDTYEGGELVIEDRIEDRAFKLGRGEMLLYPSEALHRVEPVTSGERLAVVGWFTSWVRDPARREILVDLDRSISALAGASGDATEAARLAKTRSNLLRMWAE